MKRIKRICGMGIDAAAMERPCATEILRCVSGLRISDQVIATDGLVFAVNIDRTDLLAQLNAFFTRYEGSPAQQELFARLIADDGTPACTLTMELPMEKTDPLSSAHVDEMGKKIITAFTTSLTSARNAAGTWEVKAEL